MNKIKKLLLQALAIKCGIVIIGISILGARYMVAHVWFSAQENIADTKKFIFDHPQEDVNQRNSLGQTGLMYAAGNSKFDLAVLLIEKGANLNLISEDALMAALKVAIT
jgi:ankyrin repeat protein